MASGAGARVPGDALVRAPCGPCYGHGCFGGRYRIVDGVLSNFVNSGLSAMYVLVQYKSQSLIEHLRESWRIGDARARYHVSPSGLIVIPKEAVASAAGTLRQAS